MPRADPEAVTPYLGMVQMFQALAVQPGPAGQKFMRERLDAIMFLRHIAPNATIEVDGGIDPETARLAAAAGADEITSESYIFKATDPAGAYKELSEI